MGDKEVIYGVNLQRLTKSASFVYVNTRASRKSRYSRNRPRRGSGIREIIIRPKRDGQSRVTERDRGNAGTTFVRRAEKHRKFSGTRPGNRWFMQIRRRRIT